MGVKQAVRDATWDRTDASSLPIGDPPGPMRGLGSRVAAQPPFPEARVGDRPASTQATIRTCRLQRWREPGWPSKWSQDRAGCPLGGRGTLSGPVWGSEGLLAGERRLTSLLEKA